MNNKYFIGGAVIVLVVLAWFLFGKQSAIAPSGPEATSTVETGLGGAAGTGEAPTGVKGIGTTNSTVTSVAMTKGGAYIVSYTNGGFTPATLTIKRGKSVRFVNNSNRAMSITAVDQQSQVYRELNQEQAVGKGGYYDFTFVAPGIWAYTDRNYRVVHGTIIVE